MRFHTVVWSLGFGLAALSASSTSAQTMKPGLWESTVKMGGNPERDQAMAKMQQELAKMPPEQRKKMEAMFGKQGIGPGAGGAMAIKVCITKEMAERGHLQTQQQGNCTTTVSERSSKGMKMVQTPGSWPSHTRCG